MTAEYMKGREDEREYLLGELQKKGANLVLEEHLGSGPVESAAPTKELLSDVIVKMVRKLKAQLAKERRTSDTHPDTIMSQDSVFRTNAVIKELLAYVQAKKE